MAQFKVRVTVDGYKVTLSADKKSQDFDTKQEAEKFVSEVRADIMSAARLGYASTGDRMKIPAMRSVLVDETGAEAFVLDETKAEQYKPRERKSKDEGPANGEGTETSA